MGLTKPKHPKAIWTTCFPGQVREGQRERKDALQREYQKLAKAFKKANPWCRLCQSLRPNLKPRRTTDVHHYKGKAGRLLVAVQWFLPSCRTCHDWAHQNIEAARALGLIAEKGSWNKI